jgi:hypothetical protein
MGCVFISLRGSSGLANGLVYFVDVPKRIGRLVFFA